MAGSSREILLTDSIANAAAVVSPAVVHISVTGVSSITHGTGTIIDPDGTILTCSHTLVSISPDQTPIFKGQIEVTLQDGSKFGAILLNCDPTADIALLKLNSAMPLPTATLGKSANLHVGDLIIALGSPLHLKNSVTFGIISCTDRKGRDANLPVLEGKYLQVDCSINEGNSGSPLINLQAEVVGVVLSKLSNAEGLAFAIPIDSVSEIIKHFKKHRVVNCWWLGIKVNSKFEESNPSTSSGILVQTVTRGSPAHLAGIRRLDTIIAVDEISFASLDQFNGYIQQKIGKKVVVHVERQGILLLLPMVPVLVVFE